LHATHTLWFIMSDTSIRVKAETYKAIVKTRGAFEQTFGRKLTLDDAVYLAGSYVNIAYDIYQDLEKDGYIKVVPQKDGLFDIKWTRIDKILEKAIPRLMEAFQNLKKMLSQKESAVLVASGQVS
jgi:hypothetical protein